MNQKRTRIPLPHPKPGKTGKGAWVFLLIGSVLLAVTALLGWTLASALQDGLIVTRNRAGPKLAYSQAQQPTQFYGELLWQCASTLLLGALAVATLWIGRVLMGTDKRRR
ncbi:hypothetical protein H7A76_04180 [Pseudomonas sp. MSSRFD41]|uniref:hypothetical protein n=1 Tax=unclassified Pseudomonas TaxID=196821 RepID=UPI00163A8E4C|nr:hypothetical protein [Pseudomonas sp. MSSRFD41]MBC2654632.1 hypothetical protein [Pseudomonas sp. MSSRFD41]